MRIVHVEVQYATLAREVAVGQEKAMLARDPWMEYCKPDLLILMHCDTDQSIVQAACIYTYTNTTHQNQNQHK